MRDEYNPWRETPEDAAEIAELRYLARLERRQEARDGVSPEDFPPPECHGPDCRGCGPGCEGVL